MATTLQSHDQELSRLPIGGIPVRRTAPPVRVLPAAPARRERRWSVAVGAVAAGLAVGAAGAAGAVTARTAPPPAASGGFVADVSVPGRILTAFADGTWQVGVDVAPGTYRTGGGPGCHHAVRRPERWGRRARCRGPGSGHRRPHGGGRVVRDRGMRHVAARRLTGSGSPVPGTVPRPTGGSGTLRRWATARRGPPRTAPRPGG